jgi:hypothetical protein
MHRRLWNISLSVLWAHRDVVNATYLVHCDIVRIVIMLRCAMIYVASHKNSGTQHSSHATHWSNDWSTPQGQMP